MRRALLLLGLLAAGCAPALVPVDVAERQCADQVLAQAARPRTTGAVGFGMATGSGGTSTGVSLGVSTDLSQPRDPEAAFASCVARRSGQPPTRPLFDRG